MLIQEDSGAAGGSVAPVSYDLLATRCKSVYYTNVNQSVLIHLNITLRIIQ